MIYHIYIMYCVQYKLEGEYPYYQPTRCDFTKYFFLQCYLVIIETLCITKNVICGIVLVKNGKIVFTLKQIYFSFPAQTAVSYTLQNNHWHICKMLTCIFAHLQKCTFAQQVPWQPVRDCGWLCTKLSQPHWGSTQHTNHPTISSMTPQMQR